MNNLAISGILIFISSLISVVLVLSASPRRGIHIIWSLFSFSVALWGWGLFKGFTTNIESEALFWSRFLNLSAVFIPIFFIHFVISFTGNINKKRKELFFYYPIIVSYFLLSLIYVDKFIPAVKPMLGYKYYPVPGLLYYFFPLIFGFLAGYGIILLFKEWLTASAIRKNQIKYLFLGVFVGFMGGSTTFFPVFGIKIYPLGTYLVPLYVLTVAYAIAKYRLLDIHFVVRKAITYAWIILLVFISTSCIHLVPLSENIKFFLYTLIASTFAVLSTKIIPKTEVAVNNVLYKEKYKYIEKIEDFTEEMPFIPEIEDLFQRTATTLARTLGIEKVAIFTLDPVSNSYSLKAQFGLDRAKDLRIPVNNELIEWMRTHKEILVKEEIEKILHKKKMDAIREILEKLNGSICIPVMLEKNLIGIISLGEKHSGEMYSHIDLRILQRLGTLFALSLNHKRIVAELQREKQLAELNKNKLNVITSMASGFADRLGNNLQAAVTFFDNFSAAMKGIAGEQKSEAREGLESFANVTNSSIKKLVDLTDLMRSFYTAKYVFQKYEPEEFIDIVNELKEVLKPDIGNKQIKIDCNLVGNPPATVFDRDTIKEVLRHLLQNSIHAIPETRKGNIAVKVTGPVKKNGMDYLGIFVEDNGTGIAESFRGKLFIPFKTTKGTVGGLGLGLVTCQFFMAQHEGEIKFVKSETDINLPDDKRGTTFYIDLPVKDKPTEATPDYRDLLKEFRKR